MPFRLEINSEVNIGQSSFDHKKIESINIENVDYADFFEKYMVNNVPCIIKNVSASWECNTDWIKDNSINFDYFKQGLGELQAPVANCDDITFNTQCKIEMKIKDYMMYLETEPKSKTLYLKDWHLKRLKPDSNFYYVPFVFASDWLNEFSLDNNEDDFMFVYIGPEKSWTPLHADVYNSHSWSVNVIGKKKWIFFPPKEELKMKDSFGNLPLLFDASNFEGVEYYEIIQEKGDALFVPSGWHHQVVNMSDTISINHNWINSSNLDIVTSSLLDTLTQVEKEISDLKDSIEFVSQCQVVLKADYRMDLPDYIHFLCYIADKRIKQLNDDNILFFGLYTIGQNHIRYDLKIIMKNLKVIASHPLIANQSLIPCIKCNINDIIKSISKALDSVQL